MASNNNNNRFVFVNKLFSFGENHLPEFYLGPISGFDQEVKQIVQIIEEEKEKRYLAQIEQLENLLLEYGELVPCTVSYIEYDLDYGDDDSRIESSSKVTYDTYFSVLLDRKLSYKEFSVLKELQKISQQGFSFNQESYENYVRTCLSAAKRYIKYNSYEEIDPEFPIEFINQFCGYDVLQAKAEEERIRKEKEEARAKAKKEQQRLQAEVEAKRKFKTLDAELEHVASQLSVSLDSAKSLYGTMGDEIRALAKEALPESIKLIDSIFSEFSCMEDFRIERMKDMILGISVLFAKGEKHYLLRNKEIRNLMRRLSTSSLGKDNQKPKPKLKTKPVLKKNKQ